jgi:hypothetical protein
MRRRIASAAVAAGVFVPSLLGGGASTEAKPALVASPAAICRLVPDPSAFAVLTFRKGIAVDVIEEHEGWSLLEIHDTPDCWVPNEELNRNLNLGGDLAAPDAPRAVAPSFLPPPGTRRPATPATAPAYTPAPAAPSVGGSCPCSGTRVCVGPRGGRYCITSGGRKRYGV